jgi:hypothetical protein
MVAVSFFLLTHYIAIEAIRALAAGDPEASISAWCSPRVPAIFEPALGWSGGESAPGSDHGATAGGGDAGPAVPLPSDCAVRRAGRHYVVVPDGSTGSRSASWAGAWSKDSGHELGDHAPAHASQVCRADSLTRDPCPFRGHCLAATGAGRDRHRGQLRAGWWAGLAECALALPTSSSHLCPVSRWLWLAGAGGDAGRFAVVGVRCG